MPSLVHRVRLQDYFSVPEYQLLQLMLRLLNATRAACTPPLAPVTEDEVVTLFRESVRATSAPEEGR
jgi:hypothetical protein